MGFDQLPYSPIPHAPTSLLFISELLGLTLP